MSAKRIHLIFSAFLGVLSLLLWVFLPAIINKDSIHTVSFTFAEITFGFLSSSDIYIKPFMFSELNFFTLLILLSAVGLNILQALEIKVIPKCESLVVSGLLSSSGILALCAVIFSKTSSSLLNKEDLILDIAPYLILIINILASGINLYAYYYASEKTITFSSNNKTYN